MRSKFSVLARRTRPTTRYPFSSSSSARYDPSCPVIPVMTAVGIGSSLPRPPVAVLEPHHVVELGRRRLEHVDVLDRRHAVPHPGGDVPAVARAEADDPARSVRRRVGRRDLELEHAGEDADRLLFHAVVLVAQRLALPDVEDLPDVSLRPGPDRL